ncbi:uncharacterized protein BYT42DRAFT_201995 [Radiomyces spectabilis]|uniref:uncharacterized protein n=1 Tax=Radiomyces spectabilis TaxID=64574 RepID=UPI00222043B2|nr:uncharacterized protein BYT42DRAFT_201995 [Radiomyces spectabilis]KAI8391627.1 hypothetical protein BYT42DRAFT_201995 [Radiomyces spectabilis]
MAFAYEDGFGNAVDESGHHVLDMDVDEENYPITNYDRYMALKPPEQEKVNNTARSDKSIDKPIDPTKRGTYADYSDKQKEDFFFLVKNLTAGKTAKQLGIPRRTGYNWLEKDQKCPNDEIKPNTSNRTGGRPPILNNVHKEHLIKFVDANPLAPLDAMMEDLTSNFEGLSCQRLLCIIL